MSTDSTRPTTEADKDSTARCGLHSFRSTSQKPRSGSDPHSGVNDETWHAIRAEDMTFASARNFVMKKSSKSRHCAKGNQK